MEGREDVNVAVVLASNIVIADLLHGRDFISRPLVHEIIGSRVIGRAIVPDEIVNIVAHTGNFALTWPVNASPVNNVIILSFPSVLMTVK